MVNGAGYYLRGLPLDRNTGNPLGSSPVPIQITNDVVPARATDVIKYRASLPTTPKTANATSTAGSELMQASLIGSATINATNSANFVATSVSGGSITAYDSLGNQVNVQVRWAKTANAAAGPPPSPTPGAPITSPIRPPAPRPGHGSAAISPSRAPGN